MLEACWYVTIKNRNGRSSLYLAVLPISKRRQEDKVFFDQ